MPTLKQKRALKESMENRGKIGPAMVKAGYSLATAKNPKNLTESRGWEELTAKFLPDKELLKIHSEGLDATKIYRSSTGLDKTIPDYAVQHKYLETAYKLKGWLPYSDSEPEPEISQDYTELIAMIRKVYGSSRNEPSKERQ